MNKKLKELLKFAEFTNLFAGVYRKTILNKDGSPENNSQHSFQIAIVAWYICQKENLDLNIEKILKYSLIHDLAETYSGTFPAYQRNKRIEESKTNAEKQSILKIKEDFKEFQELGFLIDQYSELNDKESKFIYALDKLIPIINIEINNHDFYYQTQTTYDEMIKVKDQKISKDPVIYEYFKLLREFLSQDAKFFWPENKERDYSLKEYWRKIKI